MQGQDTQKQDNVVSLFTARQQAKAADKTEAPAQTESFEDVMTRNAKNKERVEKERLSANKSVLRSYRIKQH